MESCSPGSSRESFSLRATARYSVSIRNVDLAAARDSGHRGEQPERNIDGDVFQVVGARAEHGEALALDGLPPLVPHRDLLEAGEILPGEAVRVRHHFVGRAFGHHFAAMHAGARAHVHDIVGGEDGVLVVLDDQNGSCRGRAS